MNTMSRFGVASSHTRLPGLGVTSRRSSDRIVSVASAASEARVQEFDLKVRAGARIDEINEERETARVNAFQAFSDIDAPVRSLTRLTNP